MSNEAKEMTAMRHYSSYYMARRAMPDAVMIIRVTGGFTPFPSRRAYDTWNRQR